PSETVSYRVPLFPLRRAAFGLPLAAQFAAVRFLPRGRLPIPARARPIGPICRALRSIGSRNWPAFFAFLPRPVLRRVSSFPRRAAMVLRLGFCVGGAARLRSP